MNQNNSYPEKGTREYHVRMLKKLKGWLDQNPKNNPVVTDEAAALAWVLEEIGEV
jgi:hypothetical protein